MDGKDAKRYRDGYPGQEDDPDLNLNLLFFQNKKRSEPDGDYADEIIRKWKGKYAHLERHHGYIQWIFPIREHGVNSRAQPLQLHEMKEISASDEMKERLVGFYDMMLDFYGFKLVNRETGEIERAENWKERLRHLNGSFHNYLRITRILKSLGELGFEHFKKHFVERLIVEALEERTIPNASRSLKDFWIPVLRVDEEREAAAARFNDLAKISRRKGSSSGDDSDSDGDVKFDLKDLDRKEVAPPSSIAVGESAPDPSSSGSVVGSAPPAPLQPPVNRVQSSLPDSAFVQGQGQGQPPPQ